MNIELSTEIVIPMAYVCGQLICLVDNLDKTPVDNRKNGVILDRGKRESVRGGWCFQGVLRLIGNELSTSINL